MFIIDLAFLKKEGCGWRKRDTTEALSCHRLLSEDVEGENETLCTCVPCVPVYHARGRHCRAITCFFPAAFGSTDLLCSSRAIFTRYKRLLLFLRSSPRTVQFGYSSSRTYILPVQYCTYIICESKIRKIPLLFSLPPLSFFGD